MNAGILTAQTESLLEFEAAIFAAAAAAAALQLNVLMEAGDGPIDRAA